MANRNIIKWRKGFPPVGSTPHLVEGMDTYVAVFNSNDNPDIDSGQVANGEWMSTEPIPTDIHSDFIITAERLAGSSNLPLEIEGCMDPFMKNKTGDAWDSLQGEDLTWNVSGSANPNNVLDWVKVNIAEIGLMPYIRLAYKNSTGGAVTVVWRVTVNFDRGI
tara:strand:+ start:726 stop:1214 length:489 start_codon:yes stop_codon:yes gene_type:complete